MLDPPKKPSFGACAHIGPKAVPAPPVSAATTRATGIGVGPRVAPEIAAHTTGDETSNARAAGAVVEADVAVALRSRLSQVARDPTTATDAPVVGASAVALLRTAQPQFNLLWSYAQIRGDGGGEPKESASMPFLDRSAIERAGGGAPWTPTSEPDASDLDAASAIEVVRTAAQMSAETTRRT